MGLLEKLRLQPKIKHPDPSVRLEALNEIEDADQETLHAVASEDADPRVRRAAIARLTSPAALTAIVRNDGDPGLREQAVARLVALSERGDEASREAVEALAALGRQRELASVARSSAPEAIRRAAVELVSDQKGLGGIARHAADADTRLRAVERLSDPAELEAVALRGEHADAAVAALDRLPSPSEETLHGVVQRARTKAVQKRARVMLHAREQAARPAPSAPQVGYVEADQTRARQLTDQMQALGEAPDMTVVRETYAALRVAWVELLADADIHPEHVERFEGLSETVRERLRTHEQARIEQERRQQALAAEQADRIALCVEVETLDGDDLPERLAALRARWEELPPMPETWAAELQQRFEAACRAAERRHQRRLEVRELAARAPELVQQIEQLAASDEDYAAIRGQWQALRRQWQQVAREAPLDPDLTARHDAAASRLEARETAYRAQRLQSQQQNLQRLQGLVADLETRAAAENLTLREAEKLLKEARLAIGTMGPLPTKQDREDLTVRLQAVRATLTPRIKELRDAEEWKRWANVQVQEELCARMEALIPVADTEPEKAAGEMRALQEKWKSVASAPRSQAEALWTRFKTAQDQVYEKCKDVFAQQAAERQENLKKKEALVARAEALADSTDWVRTAEAIKQLQAEWKTIGPVTRGHEKAIWERFRAACDRFFTRRQEDLKHRKHEWAENLARKEALIAEAEQLAQSTDWERAAARIKQLQVEWKKIGPVRKNKSEVVWQRFRAACDTFFERYKTRDQVDLGEKLAEREAAVASVEALVPAPDTPEDAPMPDDLYPRVQAARARYLQAGELPRHLLAPLAERLNTALLALVQRWPDPFTGTELDPETTRRKMEKLVAKVEALTPPEAREPETNLSPAELLARQWREALAANTMGAAAARQAEEARHRAAEQEVRSAQAAWQRLGPLDPAIRKPLQERFDRACRRFFEQKRRHLARA